MPASQLSAISTERRVIALTSGGHALCHICELAFPALIPAVMAEFQIDADKATLLGVPAIVFFGVGALPSGLWADRRGTREAMTVYFFLVSVSALCVYCSTSIYSLCVALTLLGAAISIYHPAGLAMLSHGCSNPGRAMGINGMAGSLGVAIGPSLGIYMATQHSWRLTYVAIAVLACLGWAASLLFALDVDAKEADRSKATSSSRDGHLGVLAILFLAMLVGGFNYRTITTALPTFLSQRGTDDPNPTADGTLTGGAPEVSSFDISTGEKLAMDDGVTLSHRDGPGGGAIVFLVFALGGIGQLTGGFLADRVRPAALYTLTIAATIPCALFLARLSGPAGFAAAALLAVFMFAEQPLENTIIAEATPSNWRSTVYGLKFILVFGVASCGMYAAGVVWRYEGLARVFDMYAIGATLMVGLAAWFCVRQGRWSRENREN